MICNIDTRLYLAYHPHWAIGCFDRLRGMIGRRFRDGVLDAMVFPRCSAVHSFGMGIPLDLVFLDRDSVVVAHRANYRPWRWPAGHRRAVTVIELPAGQIALTGTRIGHRINLNSELSREAVEKLADDTILKIGTAPFSPRSGGVSK